MAASPHQKIRLINYTTTPISLPLFQHSPPRGRLGGGVPPETPFFCPLPAYLGSQVHRIRSVRKYRGLKFLFVEGVPSTPTPSGRKQPLTRCLWRRNPLSNLPPPQSGRGGISLSLSRRDGERAGNGGPSFTSLPASLAFSSRIGSGVGR